MMIRRTTTAIALALMVAGCGSSDTGGNGASVPVTTGSVPTPAPTPSPTPTPTPTSTTARNYTYGRATDFREDRTFTGYDRLDLTGDGGKVTSVTLSSSETGVTSYAVKGGNVTLPDSADLPGGGSYAAAAGNSSLSVKNSLTFNSNGGLVTIGLNASLLTYDAFTLASFTTSSIGRVFLIGFPTNPAEVAGTGTLVYQSLIAEGNNAKGNAKAQALTIDRTTGTVSGTISSAFDPDTIVDYTLVGTMDGSARIVGTVRSKDGAVVGAFRGRLFGPGGKELAALVTIKLPDGAVVAPLLTGRLQ